MTNWGIFLGTTSKSTTFTFLSSQQTHFPAQVGLWAPSNNERSTRNLYWRYRNRSLDRLLAQTLRKVSHPPLNFHPFSLNLCEITEQTDPNTRTHLASSSSAKQNTTTSPPYIPYKRTSLSKPAILLVLSPPIPMAALPFGDF